MEWFHALIGPDNGDASALQLSVRAVLLFVFGVVCIRIAGRRTFSHATALDIIVAIVVGSNISRAMTGKAPFLAALAATLVLVLLHRALAMATVRWNPLAQWLKGRPVVLVRDGVIDEPGMRRHALSRDDLLEGLRLEQVDSPEKAKLVMLENGGRISVVPMSKGG